MGLTAIVFAVAFAAGCFWAFSRHPIYGLMTYVGVFYVNPPSRWWGQSLPDLRWSLTAAFVTILALMVGRKKMTVGAPLFSHRAMVGLVIFVLWIGLQSFWAIDAEMHAELLSIFLKYMLLAGLIYKCVDSEKHLKYFLWSHVMGCLYLGYIVFTSYEGGRFEDFGGAGIGEANAGALQVVTGILVAAALFLGGTAKEKAVLLGTMPFLVNALVATISRSGFLAATVGGFFFNMFTPSRFRKRVMLTSILGVLLFLMMTGPVYWERINSIQQVGADVEGVDTGSGRLVIISAQWRMFFEHPFGCGHRCTVALSPSFLDAQYLIGGGRSSHNTFMTLLVEQGIPGVAIYVLLVGWIVFTARNLRREYQDKDGLLPQVFPAVIAVLGAITIGDLFVDHLKGEVRIWFIATLMVMVNLTANNRKAAVAAERAASAERRQ